MDRFEDVAVIGMSGVFPEAPDLGAFEVNLRSGRDSVRPLPPDRIRYSSIDPSEEYAELGCLDRIDLFDHRFFGLSPREAEFMDPHQRLTLEHACAAIENAGYRLAELKGTQTVVLLSAPRPGYQELLPSVDALELLGNAPSALAGRVSYFLDLRGLSMVVDAGCCGSLVAVDRACRELMNGDAPFALAGGISINVLFDPETDMAPFSEIMSPDARCKAFDASADGAAAGEGGAILLLKRLSDAIEDGDRIRAVIKGSSVNSNGFRATGLSAPSPAAQADVITEAWRQAGIDGAALGYIEAHGSGTKLGDVIEIQGLAEAFARAGVPPDRVPIGSVKTNVGHLDHAAGIAGLVKAILSVENATLYASLHYRSPNPLAALEEAPVVVQTEKSAWPDSGQPRRVAVSSFSLAGTNAHAVVEQAPDLVRPQPNGSGAYLVTISAKSLPALTEYRSRVADHTATSDRSIAALTQALNRGRDDHQVRLATVVRDHDDLVRWLREEHEPPGDVPARASVALLFSGDEVFDDSSIDRVAATFPAFRDALERARKITEGATDPEIARLVAAQVAWHGFITDLGPSVGAVLGTGPGHAAVRIVRSGAEARAAFAGIPGKGDIDDERVAGALEEVAAGGSVFVSFGEHGVLTERARDLGYDVCDFARAGVHEALAELYMAGVDLDWDRYYEGSPVVRMELPTYPFQRERCWCLPEGEVHGGGNTAPLREVAEVTRVDGDFGSDDERSLAAIWAEALKVQPASAEDDYFDLGGTSITGMMVLDLVEQQFGVRISFQDLYDHSTVGSLATRIRTLVASGPGTVDRIYPIPRNGHLPVSVGQEQIWFIDQLEPGKALYNIPFDLHLRGELDTRALETALGSLMERHEVLRTSFRTLDGVARVVVDVEPRYALRIIDLSPMPPDMRSADVLRRWKEEATTPFDLSRGPLFRAVLLKLAADEHVLLMTVHHIVYDGWTPQIIQGELAEMYDAARESRAPRLPGLEIQYADFAAWQREWVKGEACKAQLDYWVDHLAGAPELNLPTDRPRPAAQSYRGGMITFEIPERLVEALRDLSRAESATLFTTMLAAIDLLMYRFSGQTDIVIGTPTSGRKRRETRGLIGYFNNMLAVRSDLSGNPTFRELVHRVRDVVAGALDHDEVPFEQVVDALRPRRDLSRNPLFQVAYSHQNAPQGDRYRLGDLEIDYYAEGAVRGIPPGTSKFDLTIGVGDGGKGDAEGYIEFATDLFDEESMQELLRRLMCLLEAIARDPGVTIAELEILDERHTAELVDLLTGPAQPFELTPVHLQFERLARSAPEALAVSDGGSSISYGELDAVANRLAHHLIAQGIARGDAVALLCGRTVDFVAAALAVLKAGAAYLPLDPSHPPSRISFMLEDSAAKAIVMGGDGPFPAPPGIVVVDLAAQAAEIDGRPQSSPASPAGSRDAAYLIYTSGSTGTPKATVVEHASLANLCAWYVEAFAVTSVDRASLVASQSFDASVWELWSYLVAGASVAFAPEDARRDPAALAEWAESAGMTFVFAPTPLVEAWLAAGLSVKGLRYLMSGGDQLTRVPAGDTPVANLYGPCETTVISVAHVAYPGTSAPVPIGRPITGTRCYVLDENLRAVPRGGIGELYIAGAGLARGYLDRPALTAERFLPDPFVPGAGERMYASGDLARLRTDGLLQYLGRADDQVQIRGARVEPGEIEAALERHRAVRSAKVIAKRSGETDRLIAFAALTPGAIPGDTSAELRSHLAASLPANMVPASFMFLDDLPRTPNGKIDTDALLDLDDGAAVAREIAPPVTREQELLAGIWSEVLGVADVGIDDNFFELGGDSIVSIQIVARAARAGITLTAKDLFRYQTVAELSHHATTKKAVVQEQDEPAGPVELSPIQRWFFDLDLVDRNRWNQSMLLATDGPVDAELLRDSLSSVIAQHDALRFRFHLDDHGWRGVCGSHGDDDFLFELVDLSGHEAASHGRVIDETIERLQSSLDIERGPLAAVGLFDFGPAEPSLLFLTIHHLSIDAVSWEILLDDLEIAYKQAATGRPVLLPAKTTSFAEWANRLKEYARNADRDAEFWRTVTKDRVPRLPVDRDGDNVESSIESVVIRLPESTIDGDARPQELLATALAWGLAEWTGSNNARIDVEGHGREQLFGDVELSRTVGWFTSLFPVAFDVSGDPARDLRAVKDTYAALPDNGLSYGILRFLSPDEALRSELACASEISFNYLGRYQGTSVGGFFRPTDGDVGRTHDPTSRRAYVLDVEAVVEGAHLEVHFVYSRNLHERTTIESFAARFTEALERLTETHTGPAILDGGPKLESDAIEAVVRSSGDGVGGYELTPMQQGLLMHSLFEGGDHLYVEQLCFRVSGPLDQEGFDAAWQTVVDRHEILRTSIVWKDLLAPVGVVHRTARAPHTRLDFSALATVEREPAVEAFLKEDAGRPLDLASAPLMRTAIIDLSPDEHIFVWTHHHLILDGWSAQVILGEVLECYEAMRAGRTPALRSPAPFRNYAGWLAERDADASREFWRDMLAGFLQRRLWLGHRGTERGHDIVTGSLSEASTQALSVAAKQRRVTLNVIVQAAWARTLATYSFSDDVVFGVTMSGRSAPIPDIESTVGLLINTIPVRIRVPTGSTVGEWLREVQATQVELLEHEHTPLTEIQRVAGHSGPLFETIMAFENYPLDASWDETEAGIELTGMPYVERTNYPISLIVAPGSEMSLRLSYDRSRFAREDATALIGQFISVLEFLGRSDDEAIVTGSAGDREGIETALMLHPAVRQAAVVACDGPMGTDLIGFLAPATAGPAEDIRRHLAEELPTGRGPSRYVSLDVLPRTSRGDVDREALARSAGSASVEAGPEKMTPTEERLAVMWSDVLGGPGVRVHDNFFALGGHSLLATRVISQVRSIFDADVPIRDLFDSRSLADFAEKVTVAVGGAEIADAIARTYTELQSLSEEEVRARLLSYQAGEGGGPSA